MGKVGCREPVGPFAHRQPTAPLRVWADAPFPVRRMVRSLSAFSWRDKKMTFPAMRSATPSLGGVMRKVPLQSLWFCILPFRTRSPVLQMTCPSLWACSRGAGGAGMMGLGEGGGRAPNVTGSVLPCHAGHSAFHWVPSRALQVSQRGTLAHGHKPGVPSGHKTLLLPPGSPSQPWSYRAWHFAFAPSRAQFRRCQVCFYSLLKTTVLTPVSGSCL